MIYSPLEEFKIYNIETLIPRLSTFFPHGIWRGIAGKLVSNNYIYDIRITNMSIYIIISIIIIMIITIRGEEIKNNKWNKIIEIIYKNIRNMNKDLIGERNNKYIPIINYLFIIILINNLIGIVPYSFTPTSHFIITITMSISIIIGITILGIRKYKLKFINIFIPSGLENMKIIIPLIFVIEIISYLSRIISLSVRLSTNMISGHILLHLVSSLSNLWPTILFSLISIILIFPFYILEIAVCIIQAYVFTLLTLSYLKDIYYLH